MDDGFHIETLIGSEWSRGGGGLAQPLARIETLIESEFYRVVLGAFLAQPLVLAWHGMQNPLALHLSRARRVTGRTVRLKSSY